MSPSMRFQPDLPPGRLEKSIAAGYWGDTLFAERFESAAIALAKLSTAKRGAVLRQVDDKRAKILGRLANSYASKNREG